MSVDIEVVKKIFACVLTLITTGAMLLVSTVFTAATPPHTCNTSDTLLPDVSQVSGITSGLCLKRQWYFKCLFLM